MNFQFELTQAEFVAARQILTRRNKTYRPLWMAGFISTVAGFLFLLTARDAPLIAAAILLLMVGVFVQLYPWIQHDLSLKKQWDHYACNGPIGYEFSNTRVLTTSLFVRGEWSWKAFEKLEESRLFFILRQRSGTALTIPKRVFRDQVHQSEFRALVESNLYPKATGFPIEPLQVSRPG